MEKNDLPEAFGVFKPVGHIVIAFRSAAEQQAAQALQQQVFESPARGLDIDAPATRR